MVIRFRKSIRIMPGVRINLGKKGVSSTTFGPRGLSVSSGKRGTHLNVGVPGTGLSSRTRLDGPPKGKVVPQSDTGNLPAPKVSAPRKSRRREWLIAGAIVAGLVGFGADAPPSTTSAPAPAQIGLPDPSADLPLVVAPPTPDPQPGSSHELARRPLPRPAWIVAAVEAELATAPEPAAVPFAAPLADPEPASAYYRSCAAARAAGAAPMRRGEPGYRPGLDRDNDGVACEPSRRR